MTRDINRRTDWTPSNYLFGVPLLVALYVCFASPAFSQQAPPPDGPAPANAVAANQQNPPMMLKAIPSNIQLSSTVSFNENGMAAGQNSYFSINFFIATPPNLAIRNIRNIKVQTLLTDSGEELAVNIPQNQNEHFQAPQDMFLAPGVNQNRMQQNRRPININPPLPKKACRKITKLQGTATIEVSKGAAKRVNVGPVKAIDGKRIQLDGLDDGWFQIIMTNDGNQRRMQFVTNAETIAKVARIYFFNPDGTLIQNQGHNVSHMNRGQANSTIAMNIYAQFQEGTTAVIIMYPESQTLEVAFEGLDFPLPQVFSQGSELFDMVMKFEPLDEGFALADIAPKPQPKPAAEKPADKPAGNKPPEPAKADVAPIPADIKKLPEITFKLVETPTPKDNPANMIPGVRNIIR